MPLILLQPAGALTLNGASGINIVGNASEVDITTTGTLDINAAATTIDTSAGVTITAATLPVSQQQQVS